MAVCSSANNVTSCFPKKFGNSGTCESAHSARRAVTVFLGNRRGEDGTISKEKAFDDCVILSKEAFDPDAVFLDDIVDDDVLPCLSLAVDGLTEASDARKGALELRPEDVAANEPLPADTTMPVAQLGPDELDVYGWEPSLWKKIKGYLGL